MVTVVSATLLTLEIPVTYVSRKVFFNIIVPFTKARYAITLEISCISCLYRKT